jgi:glucose/arabinose dehydrogenase
MTILRCGRTHARRRRIAGWALALLISLVSVLPAGTVAANSPPESPVITSPEPSGVAPEDVHMEMGAPFFDADGDTHAATDWEIRTEDGQTIVWAAHNSPVLTHAHFGDGQFMGPLAGKHALDFREVYLFRVRYLDSRGAWSAWAERRFITMRLDRMPAQHVHGFLTQPAPTWRTDGDTPVALPEGATLVLDTVGSPPLLTLTSRGDVLVASPGSRLNQPASLRLRLVAPATGDVRLPATRLSVVTDHAERLTLYLPPFWLAPGATQVLWVSEAGATFFGTAEQTDFSRVQLARDVTLPWRLPPGYRLEAVAPALQLPVSLAMLDAPGSDPGAPRLYVTELHGRIKVITNDGRVRTFADNLLNFATSDQFPGSGEQGVIGICIPTGGRQVYATLVRRDEQGLFRIKIVRFTSDDGLTATGMEEILVAAGPQGRVRPSHQIQQCAFGPDGKLYTFVADGTGPRQAADDGTFNGKVLRMNPDGSAPPDNPRYDPAQPTAPISYQYTKGQRNAYGLTWRAADGELYLSENGPNIDRLVKVTPGLDYGWDGTDASMRTNAIYIWPEAHWSPVGLTFVEGAAAAGLPADLQGKLLVASAGVVYASGPQRAGKAIQSFTVAADGTVTGEPSLFARYIGEGKGSIVDLKVLDDAIYFTDLYLDDGDGGPTAPGGTIWQIRYTGAAAFTATPDTGSAPLTVTFTDTSALPGDTRTWDFGDGTTATAATVTHTYARPGRYAVSLTRPGRDGTPVERLDLVTVTAPDGSTPAPAEPVVAPARPAAAVIVFPETGKVLGGGFKHFWEAHGGLAQFGYPITQEHREVNPADGKEYTVQYFERARFEYHPEHKGTPHETQLGLLGRQVTAGRQDQLAFQPLPPDAVTASADGRYFPETSHSLSEPFRERWEATGGADIYGLPISEPFVEVAEEDGDNYVVQYFERARMEHRPEWAGTEREFWLTRLGTNVVASRPAGR